MYNYHKSSQIKQIAILVLLLLIWAALYFLPVGNNVSYQNNNETSKNENGGELVIDDNDLVDELDSQVAQLVSGMTIEQKVAQMFIITPEALTKIDRVSAAGVTTQGALSDYPVGGLIYFKDNIFGPEQITTMIANTQEFAQEISGLPLFVAVDEEGAGVARIANNENFDVFQSPPMSEITDYQSAYQTGEKIGAYLKEYGFNLDFAPVGDVINEDGSGFVKDRSFGANPEVVGELANGVAAGLKAQGILATMKHFPGIGSAIQDSHEGYALVSKTLEQLQASDLVPFQQAIEQQVDLIMVGHMSLSSILDDHTPASLAPEIITGLLKEQMKYPGLVITDALNMGAITANYTSDQAAVKAIQAGSDLLLMPEDFDMAYQGVLGAIESGKIPVTLIDQAVAKIVKVKLQMGS